MSTPPPFDPVMPPPAQMPPRATPPQDIPNHLIWNIIAMILGACICCVPLFTGIVGIVYANQVSSKLLAGDVVGAQQASRTAKIWAIVSSVLAVIGMLAGTLFIASLGGIDGYLQWLQSMQAM